VKPSSYQSFSEPLVFNAEVVPSHLAFIYLEDGEEEERRITFGELHERALGMAHDLLASGQPGDRALLLLPPGLDYVATIFGCFYAGVIGVSAPPPQPRRLERTLGRLLKIAESAEVSTVVTTTPFADAARAAIPAGHPLTGAHWLTADTSPPSTDTSIIAKPMPNDAAFLQYTSGSTADPQGVRLTHANLLDNSRFIAEAFDHDAEMSLGFNWIPPFHDMGLIGAILQPVYFSSFHHDAAPRRDPDRATSVLASPLAIVKRPIRWLRGVSRYRATTSGGPNFSYDMCVERIAAEDCEGLDLSSWEVAFNGAEPIRAQTMKAFSEKFGSHGFRSTAFFPVYGLAEATLMVTAPSKLGAPVTQRFEAEPLLANRAIPSNAHHDPLLVGCGSPDQGHRLEIVNPKTGALTAPGEVGEIWVSGPGVADGYWSGSAEGSQPFEATLDGTDDPGRFLRTGDLGIVHDGELFVIGRLSDLIILNGRNHHPHDIEALAESSESLLIPNASAAFELRAADGEPSVALAAESRNTDPGTLQLAISRIRSRVAERLELPLALTAVCERGAIPKTTSGKVQRSLCRSLLLAGELEIVAEWRSPLLSGGPGTS
jgi:acyl-CoA synthetase (AMP-forming)/AMP-acid ligase II